MDIFTVYHRRTVSQCLFFPYYLNVALKNNALNVTFYFLVCEPNESVKPDYYKWEQTKITAFFHSMIVILIVSFHILHPGFLRRL